MFYPFDTAFRPLQSSSQFRPVFLGETVQLQCGIRPGRARDLYSVQWLRNNHNLNNETNFSLSVSVESMSENGTEYQCSVSIISCFPGCPDTPVFDGPSIILIVGGECTSCSGRVGVIIIIASRVWGDGCHLETTTPVSDKVHAHMVKLTVRKYSAQ